MWQHLLIFRGQLNGVFQLAAAGQPLSLPASLSSPSRDFPPMELARPVPLQGLQSWQGGSPREVNPVPLPLKPNPFQLSVTASRESQGALESRLGFVSPQNLPLGLKSWRFLCWLWFQRGGREGSPPPRLDSPAGRIPELLSAWEWGRRL